MVKLNNNQTDEYPLLFCQPIIEADTENQILHQTDERYSDTDMDTHENASALKAMRCMR